jgi:hypothetical protein
VVLGKKSERTSHQSCETLTGFYSFHHGRLPSVDQSVWASLIQTEAHGYADGRRSTMP